jgi:CheY-like chemotaxis protein
MIVDDTPASLESVRLALDGVVPTIFMAAGGSEAIDILDRHPEIEAVVSDIMMPGMSGIELAEEIRRRNASLPVVLMTGYSDRLEAGTEVGRPVVPKPFKIEDLAACLEKAKSSIVQSANVVRLEIPGKG